MAHAVASTYQQSPYRAHLDLGGKPLSPRERRRLTLEVMRAGWALRLHEEQVDCAGDAGKSKALAERWSRADHDLYRDVRANADGDGD